MREKYTVSVWVIHILSKYNKSTYNTFKGKDCHRRETAEEGNRYSERVVIEERMRDAVHKWSFSVAVFL